MVHQIFLRAFYDFFKKSHKKLELGIDIPYFLPIMICAGYGLRGAARKGCRDQGPLRGPYHFQGSEPLLAKLPYISGEMILGEMILVELLFDYF